MFGSRNGLKALKLAGISLFLASISPGCGPVAQSVSKNALNSTPSSRSHGEPAGIELPGQANLASPTEAEASHPRQRAIAYFKELIQKAEHNDIKANLINLQLAQLYPWPEAISTAFIGGTCQGEQVIEHSPDFREIAPQDCEFTYLVSQEFTDGRRFRSLSALISASSDPEKQPELKHVLPGRFIEQFL